METYTAYVNPIAPALKTATDPLCSQRDDSFYDVERAQVEPTNVDLERPRGSDEDFSHKEFSQNDLTRPL
jgi:hypothetical protein